MGKQMWPCCKTIKCQRRTIILAILVDLLSSMICAKIRPQGLYGSGEEDFLKVFTMYGHGSHLGCWTATILAIFCSPAPRRLHMKFEHHWSGDFRGEVQMYTWGPYKCIKKQTWPCHRKVKCQCTNIILSTLVDLPSPIICAKIQP